MCKVLELRLKIEYDAAQGLSQEDIEEMGNELRELFSSLKAGEERDTSCTVGMTFSVEGEVNDVTAEVYGP